MKYRNLRTGEIVRKGDEVYASDRLRWIKVSKQSIGKKVFNDDYDALMAGCPHMSLLFRRKKSKV